MIRSLSRSQGLPPRRPEWNFLLGLSVEFGTILVQLVSTKDDSAQHLPVVVDI
jgi:hypothetical protein